VLQHQLVKMLAVHAGMRVAVALALVELIALKLQALAATVAAVLVEILLAVELLQLRDQQTQAAAVVVSTTMTHQAQAVQELSLFATHLQKPMVEQLLRLQHIGITHSYLQAHLHLHNL
jgi:hypothetical protein